MTRRRRREQEAREAAFEEACKQAARVLEDSAGLRFGEARYAIVAAAEMPDGDVHLSYVLSPADPLPSRVLKFASESLAEKYIESAAERGENA